MIATLDELIMHLQLIRARHGGKLKVLRSDNFGHAIANGVQLIPDDALYAEIYDVFLQRALDIATNAVTAVVIIGTKFHHSRPIDQGALP